MKDTIVLTKKQMIPLKINVQEMQWLVVGGGEKAFEVVSRLLRFSESISLSVVAESFVKGFETLGTSHSSIHIVERKYDASDFSRSNMVIVVTENKILDEKIYAEAKQQNALVYIPSHPQLSDFYFLKEH